MSFEFDEVLKVNVSFRSRNNDGSYRNAWISLPKSEEEIDDFLKKHHYDAETEEIYIANYAWKPFDLEEVFNEYVRLEDLNLLAMQMLTKDPDAGAVNGWIESMHTPKDIIQFMNLIEQAEYIQYFEYAYDNAMWSNEEKFGWEMLDNNPEVKDFLDEHSLMDCFDAEHYGRECSIESYALCEHGYISLVDNDIDMDEYDREYFVKTYGE